MDQSQIDELGILANLRLRNDAAIKFIDELLEGISNRPSMYMPGGLHDVESFAIYLLDIRALLLGKELPDVKGYIKKQYPDIPGSVRSIAVGSTAEYKDQEYDAFTAALGEMIDELK